MKMCVVLHVDYELPGAVAKWATDQGFDISVCRPFDGEALPEVDHLDWVVSMGGPQTSLKLHDYPYLLDEVEFLKNAINQEKMVLGFCLGSQLIGEALGATTERSPEKEIGYFKIQLTDAGKKDQFLSGLPECFKVMHWHNDMPGLTADCEILAHSKGCPRQIIRYRDHVYGFQCHLEMIEEYIPDLIDRGYIEPGSHQFIQSKEELQAHDFSQTNAFMRKILDKMQQFYLACCCR